jgi:predicted alpha/beta-fold hydrolase
MNMTDGATIAVDWLIPYPKYLSSVEIRLSEKQLEANVLYGPIEVPVVIILHGINNDTGFGYMKSLMNSVADRGWIACGMNFRGCGGQKLSTPRGYNAAYTGDLRTIVQKIDLRLKKNGAVAIPIFLVGNSLGANLITKYLGEEGFSGTLPKSVKGGVSLGNPLHIHSSTVKFPFNVLLGAGVKRTVLQSWKAFRDMSSCLHFGSAVRQVLLSKTIGELDDAFAPYLIRNDPKHPFTARVGYKNGEDYWRDASSYRYIQHVTVPLMILSAQDDFLVVNPARQLLSRCLENPNVFVVKTKCGGHLGWQEAPPSGWGIGKSWANDAVCDFMDAVLKMSTSEKDNQVAGANVILESKYASRRLQSKL